MQKIIQMSKSIQNNFLGMKRAIAHPNNIPMFPPDLENMETLEAKLIPINSEKELLTPETLRKYSGYENVSDEEATEIILSLRAFAALVFDYCREKGKESVSEISDLSNLKQAA